MLTRRQFLPLTAAATRAASTNPPRPAPTSSSSFSTTWATPASAAKASASPTATPTAPSAPPTRCGLLTGRYQQRYGLEWALGPGRKGYGLNPEHNTLARYFQRAGYHTALFGKWRLGYEPAVGPNRHGFDEFYGLLSGNVDHYSHKEINKEHDWYENLHPVHPVGYSADLIRDRPLQYLDAHSTHPWQLMPKPFLGQIAVGPLSQRTVARAQLLRPYPQFDAVTSQAAGWASSTYHALAGKAEIRYPSGVSILVSNTYSKLMDFGIGPFAGESLGAGGFHNWANLAAGKSPSTLDQTHRFIWNAVYEIPWLAKRPGLAGQLLAGWPIGGIWSNFTGGGQRPNWSSANPCVANPIPTRWLDSSVFSNPPLYAFGNSPRTFNGCHGHGTAQVHTTLTKNTKIRERLNVQFRAEVFNLSNTVRFAPPTPRSATRSSAPSTPKVTCRESSNSSSA